MSDARASGAGPQANRAGGKRLKWEPAALMVLVLGLGLWIAFGPGSKPKFATAPDALTQDVRIGNTRGLVEAFTPPGQSEQVLRLWMPNGPKPPKSMTISEARERLGTTVVEQTLGQSQNWVFKTFNITSWSSVVWVGIGLIGQLAFSGRMVLQWIVSEKKRQSVIGESFWWFSLFGGLTLFSYFVWRQDPVAMLGQASGIVIYARNIRLIFKHKARAARLAEAERQEAADAPIEAPPVVHTRTQSPERATAGTK